MNFHFYVDYSKYYKMKYELFILGQIIYFTNLFKSDGENAAVCSSCKFLTFAKKGKQVTERESINRK